MSDVFIVLGSMLVSFIVGAVGILFFGGRTTLNYLTVKISRGKKVLLFVNTTFGWKSFVSKKDQNTLVWKYDKKKVVTSVIKKSVFRYVGVTAAFVDADNSSQTLQVKDGELAPDNFDMQTFNNILIRALSRPDGKGSDKLEKLIIAAILLAAIGLVMNFVVISKLGKLAIGGVI